MCDDMYVGLTRGHSGTGGDCETSVMYSTAYDGVDIGISYERLAIPGAPPPYTPTPYTPSPYTPAAASPYTHTCDNEDESPPAYSTLTQPNSQSSSSSHPQQPVISSGKVYNYYHYSKHYSTPYTYLNIHIHQQAVMLLILKFITKYDSLFVFHLSAVTFQQISAGEKPMYGLVSLGNHLK